MSRGATPSRGRSWRRNSRATTTSFSSTTRPARSSTPSRSPPSSTPRPGPGAAVAGYSVVETIKRVQGGAVVETVPRGDLFAATTPQVFRAGLLRPAVAKDGGPETTDDAQLVERTGGAVTVVLTSRWNIKITYPEDLAWAEAFLARLP